MFLEVALWAFVLRSVTTFCVTNRSVIFSYVVLRSATIYVRYEYQCVIASVSVRIVVFHECCSAVICVGVSVGHC